MFLHVLLVVVLITLFLPKLYNYLLERLMENSVRIKLFSYLLHTGQLWVQTINANVEKVCHDSDYFMLVLLTLTSVYSIGLDTNVANKLD